MRNKIKSGDDGGHIFQNKVSDPSSLPDKLAAEQQKLKKKKLRYEKKIHRYIVHANKLDITKINKGL